MTQLKQRLGERRLLWIDSTRYALALLGVEPSMWLSTPDCIAWYRKVQGLVASDVVTLPLGEVCDAWIARDAELQAALTSSTRRPTLPLRTLLVYEPLRAHLVELASAVRALMQQPLFALSLPSPQRAIDWARRLDTPRGDADEDAVDTAASYLADFLRVFANSGVDLLVLEEQSARPPNSMLSFKLYQPLFNLGAHYRWDVGLRLVDASELADVTQVPGLDFVIASSVVPGALTGVALPAAFWEGESPVEVPPGHFCFAEIPVSAQPETVLARLSSLRSN